MQIISGMDLLLSFFFIECRPLLRFQLRLFIIIAELLALQHVASMPIYRGLDMMQYRIHAVQIIAKNAIIGRVINLARRSAIIRNGNSRTRVTIFTIHLFLA